MSPTSCHEAAARQATCGTGAGASGGDLSAKSPPTRTRTPEIHPSVTECVPWTCQRRRETSLTVLPVPGPPRAVFGTSSRQGPLGVLHRVEVGHAGSGSPHGVFASVLDPATTLPLPFLVTQGVTQRLMIPDFPTHCVGLLLCLARGRGIAHACTRRCPHSHTLAPHAHHIQCHRTHTVCRVAQVVRCTQDGQGGCAVLC